ncbi:apolipoprotein N-acyltransferase [Hippea alviniae]|uniref:apolipoprotein N-acyltransferase n=1 Tax=Hippea alviniae TaxID=1279027 RepID=UPI0003F79D0F|nr:apolipoprotein N-acyltransferase [Hippea alviniae]
MKLSAKYLLLFSILPIASYHLSILSLIAFVPIFLLLEEGKSHIYIAIYMFVFYLYIYSGIYKSTHTYYGLFFLLSIGLVVALALYQAFYILIGTWVFKKSNLPLEFYPIFFVAFEFLKDKLFYGMPLGNLNILTYNLTSFIQDASLFGSLFVDLKILLINLAVFLFLKKEPKKATIILLLTLIPLAFVHDKKQYSKTATLTIVQGNIPQNQKWEEKYLKRNLNIYTHLSNQLKSDYVLWPESAYPYLFSKSYSPSIKRLVQSNKFTLIFGAIREKNGKYYNSVISYSKQKIEIYDKQKLVPFAEFIPLGNLLGFKDESLSKGKSNVIFKEKLKIAPMVCYEENFESIARRYKTKGAELLAVFTNDAWFDKTPTFYLFPRSDIYRAIENRMWLVRAANTGISFIVNPEGKIKAEIKPDKREILTTKLKIAVYKKTIYDRFGWLFGWVMLFASILLSFYKTYKARQRT